ncbi:T6SS immunity protein Tli4 family protein [Desulfomicrobium escambiense]|uniref:T6SS immunity protein Tli4 family protein n=1 Tax=Desulfomicrobium escambiense TaxID=29503 RepID=UPI00041FCC79|nr:T6SS immunity protein Tli4 family protein [Desulfomicrobium escambiense]
MQHTTTSQPPLPVPLYPVGRFLFPVPQGLEFQGRIININDMSIEETDWNSGDRAKQFRALWEPVRDEARKHYDVYKNTPVVRGGFVQEDVSEHFGHPAVLLCYSAQNGAHWIDTFVALPDWILRIKEETAYEIGKECLGDLKGTTLDFFRHYRTDRSDLPADMFWTGRGWMRGMKTWDESADAYARREETDTGPKISLNLRTYTISTPDEPAKSIKSIRKILDGNKIDLKILRSRHRTFEGMPGLEEVVILSGHECGTPKSTLFAKWAIEAEAKNPQRPTIYLEMSCDAAAQDDALRFWDASINNFISIQAWHAKMRGGR